MNKILITVTVFLFVSLLSCSKDDDHSHGSSDNYDYHIHIHSPDTSDKHVGDSIHLHIDFESGTSETVHHVNIIIKNKADGTIIYNEPNEAHVHAITGKHEHHDDFILSSTNQISGHTDWILEAKVWGHEANEGEVTETLEFHVHP